MKLSLPEQLNDCARRMFEHLLDSKGFNLTRSVFEEAVFGNIHVSASCEQFGIDYRLDRGDESVFIVVEGTEYLIEDATRLIDSLEPATRNLRDEVLWLMSHIDALKQALYGDRLKTSKQLLEQSRMERLRRTFPGAVVGS